jgi:hypothetical protein
MGASCVGRAAILEVGDAKTYATIEKAVAAAKPRGHHRT